MTLTLPLALVFIAAACATSELFRTQGRSAAAWGLLCLCAVYVLGPRF